MVYWFVVGSWDRKLEDFMEDLYPPANDNLCLLFLQLVCFIEDVCDGDHVSGFSQRLQTAYICSNWACLSCNWWCSANSIYFASLNTLWEILSIPVLMICQYSYYQWWCVGSLWTCTLWIMYSASRRLSTAGILRYYCWVYLVTCRA